MMKIASDSSSPRWLRARLAGLSIMGQAQSTRLAESRLAAALVQVARVSTRRGIACP
jgi:hypothetical protein